MARSLLKDYGNALVEIFIFLSIIVFLLNYFSLEHILSRTITTGGDTASHYYTAKYLKDYLLPNGKIIGWLQGNYAGFPLFQMYFPLPFVIMALLSYVIPLEVAFKIVSCLGIFLLPFTVYLSLRLFRFGFPIPIFGAVSTLSFLFMEANSMWGGNILSTLAGEFSYSLSFALCILFIGSLYDGIVSGRYVLRNALLVALIGFGHGYTLLFSGLASLFFLITTVDFWRKFKYLFKVHVLGFSLIGFWIVPLLVNAPLTTRFNLIWKISSVFEILPAILLPYVFVAVLARIVEIPWLLGKKSGDQGITTASLRGLWDELDARIFYLWFCVTVSFVFFLIAYKINVVDIRFLPFLQVFLVIIAAIELGRFVQLLKMQWLFPVVLGAATLLWAHHNAEKVGVWVAWNYSGFEGKPRWEEFSSMNKYLKGGPSDPRVVYEHSSLNNGDLGTPRAFESLPLFSGRSTLEGLYMTASPTAPFVFYIQSEISKETSCPFPDYSCTVLNLKNGARHLGMFNVRDFIVRSDRVKAEIKRHPEFALSKSFGPFEIYELSDDENGYVTPLEFEPVLYETDNWKYLSYRWFRDFTVNDVHLVFTDKADEVDKKRFRTIIQGEDLYDLPKVPVNAPCSVEEEITEEEISIKTDCIGRPLLIKVSYHPNWKVAGADRVYLVSPSFMLIYPERENVRLRFSNTGVEYAGFFLTVAALVIMAMNVPFTKAGRIGRITKATEDIYGKIEGLVERNRLYVHVSDFMERNKLRLLFAVLALIGLLVLSLIFLYEKDEPTGMFAKAMNHYNKNMFSDAREVFGEILRKYPESASGNSAGYYYALSYFQEGRYQETLEAFQRMIRNNRGSNMVPAAYYYMALSNARMNNIDEATAGYKFLIERYPATMWANYSRDRLNEIGRGEILRPPRADHLYSRAWEHLSKGAYAESRRFFSMTRKEFPETRLAEHSAYYYVFSFFKEQEFTTAINGFKDFIRDYPESPHVPQAYYHMGMSYRMLKDVPRAKDAFEMIVREFPDSWLSGNARKRLDEMN